MTGEILSISKTVSAMRAGVDRFEEALLARDAKRKAEIGQIQEKFKLERLIRLQAKELKRAQESYKALLKKVKENGFCDVEELGNKNPMLKRKRVDDDDSCNLAAELRNRVAELENEKLELEVANKKNLETIENLRTKLARKNINDDAEPLRNVCVSVGRNTEKEPQAPLQRDIVDIGHSLGASEMSDKFIIMVHHSCEIIHEPNVRFCCKKPIAIQVRSSISLEELHTKIIRRLGGEAKSITEMLYRMPMCVDRAGLVRYGCCDISNDEDLSMMFDCHCQFPNIHVMELYVVVGESNIRHISSGASAPTPVHGTHDVAIEQPVVRFRTQPLIEEDIMIGPSQVVGILGNVNDYDSPIHKGNYNEHDFDDDNTQEPDQVPDDDDDIDGVGWTQPQYNPYSQNVSKPQAQSKVGEVTHYTTLNLAAMKGANEVGSSLLAIPGDISGKRTLLSDNSFQTKKLSFLL